MLNKITIEATINADLKKRGTTTPNPNTSQNGISQIQVGIVLLLVMT
jgi:hypothetical protein